MGPFDRHPLISHVLLINGGLEQPLSTFLKPANFVVQAKPVSHHDPRGVGDHHGAVVWSVAHRRVRPRGAGAREATARVIPEDMPRKGGAAKVPKNRGLHDEWGEVTSGTSLPNTSLLISETRGEKAYCGDSQKNMAF